MRDYTYIDGATGEPLLVCIAVDGICKADYQFKDIIGVWPWEYKHIHVKSEPTGLEDMYIPEN